MAKYVVLDAVIVLLLTLVTASVCDAKSDPATTSELLKKLLKGVLEARQGDLREDKVMGGYMARQGDFPYIARLKVQRNSQWSVCGGTLVATEWVLTAGHCLDGTHQGLGKASLVQVYLGDTDAERVESGEQMLQSTEYYVHPSFGYWTGGGIKNDIALIRLPRSAALNSLVGSATLPAQGTSVPEYTQCVVAGWGNQGDRSQGTSRHLASVEVAVHSIESCKQQGRRHGEYGIQGHPAMALCAADFDNPYRQHCRGDSGGPLICNGALEGIVSYTYNYCWPGDGQPALPGFFTRVANYVDWIYGTMRGHGGYSLTTPRPGPSQQELLALCEALGMSASECIIHFSV